MERRGHPVQRALDERGVGERAVILRVTDFTGSVSLIPAVATRSVRLTKICVGRAGLSDRSHVGMRLTATG
jgi:hypothetical protein